jgi:hypothetical protein
MKKEVMNVCEYCSIGYACESDALDCEKVCALKEALLAEGFLELSESVSDMGTADANRLVRLLEARFGE